MITIVLIFLADTKDENQKGLKALVSKEAYQTTWSVITLQHYHTHSIYLLRFGIRITAVVDESRYAALARSVDEVLGGEGHEVEVLNVIAGVLSSPFSELTWVQDFAHVLHEESVAEEEEEV